MPLNKPTKMFNIIGDVNCFYRAIAYCITASEDKHAKIRDKMTCFMKEKSVPFSQYFGENYNFQQHAKL